MAIAIPVFTTQLEKSRESTDVANLRGAYAAGTTAALTGYYGTEELGSTSSLQYKPGVDGSLAAAGDQIGQGTSTNGKTDLNLISGWSDYTNTDDVRKNVIEVTFTNGMVSKVNFKSGT